MRRLFAGLAGFLLALTISAAPAVAGGTNRFADVAPFYGGDRINVIHGNVTTKCTGGPEMYDGTGNYFSITATHCGLGAWTAGATSQAWGSITAASGSLDTEVADLSTAAANRVFADPAQTYRSVYSWETTAQDAPGLHVCVDGSFSKEVCGFVDVYVDQTFVEPGGATVQHTVWSRCGGTANCLQDGDSGAPVFAICTVSACTGSVEMTGILLGELNITDSSGTYWVAVWEPVRYIMAWIWANVNGHMNIMCQLCTPR